MDHLGYSVFAGCADCNSVGARAIASRGSHNLAVLPLDVTKQDVIDDVFQTVSESVGHEGIVNQYI